MARQFELQGHRGARGLFPENTLEGFAAAIALGIDRIELDVAVTADGVAVVFHDATLNRDLVRGPDGAWLGGPGPAIRTLTLDALIGYDVGRLRPGSIYAARHRRQVPHDGARIPTLAATFRATGATRLDVELKTLPDRPGLTVSAAEMADIVLAVASDCGATARLDLRSFDWRGLRHAHRRCPEIGLTFLTQRHMLATASLWWDGTTPADHGGSVPRAVAAEAPGAGWAPDHHGLTRAAVAEAQALGLRVVPWTVNAPSDLRRLIAWGVDGVCTDRPDLARAAMAAAGLPLPARAGACWDRGS